MEGTTAENRRKKGRQRIREEGRGKVRGLRTKDNGRGKVKERGKR